MTTFADLMAVARTHLDGDERPRLNILATGMDTVVTTVVLTYTGIVAAGSVLTMGTEDMYVIAYDPGTLTATVIRGYRGTKVSHSTGSVVSVNPRFSDYQILQAMVTEINSWPRNALYKVETCTLSLGVGESVAMIPTAQNDLVGMVSAVYAATWTSDWLLPVAGSTQQVLYRDLSNAQILRNVDGFANPVLTVGFIAQRTITLACTVATPIVATGALTTDDPSVLGLQPFMEEVAELGAAARLIRPRETGRTSRQALGQPREATEVPAGHIRSAGMDMWQQRNEALARAVSAHRALYPLRFT